MRYLGIDLGSSFFKGAVLDLEALTIDHIERVPSPRLIQGRDVLFKELDPGRVVDAARAVVERLAAHAPDAAGIVACSQMNSLVFARADGSAASNIITWQDQRTLMPIDGRTGARSYFEEVYARITPAELRQLGNEARPGFPLCYLFWLSRNDALPAERAVASSLPGFVAANLCKCEPKTDLTHAYAHGALNIETGDWHRPVLEKLGLGDVLLPEIVSQDGTRTGLIVGEASVGSRRVPVFAPVGDYQCSQAGAFLQKDELSINVSTGSAVIRLASGLEHGDFQTRPFFDGKFLRTITHIPAGRALNALIRLLSELAGSQGHVLSDPWDYILEQAGNAKSAGLRVDPAFYFSAMGERGSITGVREENLTVGHLFRAAFEGMAENYALCARRVWPTEDWERVVFSGGLALKVELLRRLICDRLGEKHRLACEEDTLNGLLVLALRFSQRVASVDEAMGLVRKNSNASQGSDN